MTTIQLSNRVNMLPKQVVQLYLDSAQSLGQALKAINVGTMCTVLSKL